MKRLWYMFLKVLAGLAQRVYFRRIEVRGKEYIPRKGAVILVVRHPNALMDPLVASVHIPRQLHFLVRADVFTGGIVTWFWSTMNMIPVYRLRDGKRSMKKNKDTFALCREVLHKGGMIQIFGEGEHNELLRLNRLKKGTARIVFGALAENPDLDVQILPVGLHYSNIRRFRADLALVFGPPLSARNFFNPDDPESNEGMLALTRAFEDEMRKLVIDLRSETQYEEQNTTRKLLMHHFFGPGPWPFVSEKKFTDAAVKMEKEDPLGFAEVLEMQKTHSELCASGGLNTEGLPEKIPSAGMQTLRGFLLILGAPLFAISILLHGPVLLLADRSPKLVEEEMFFGALRMITGMFLMPVLYLIYAIVLSAFLGPLWGILAGLILLPLWGVLSLYYHDYAGIFLQNRRFLKFARKSPDLNAEIKQIQTSIVQRISKSAD